MTEQQRYTIDDFARFSPWPARLLGIEPWEQRRKTPEEILREYDEDKWGVMLERINQSPVPLTIADAERWDMDLPFQSFTWHDGVFQPMSFPEANAIYIRLVTDTLQACMPASAIAELGCGYGKVVLRLLTNGAFGAVPFYAAEYTQSGIDVTTKLAAAGGLPITMGWCDFNDPTLTNLAVPEGAVLYTSFATPYVPELQDAFIESLIARRPKAVVHFEPCYEHCSTTSLLGMMRRRYLEVNDYNRNLMTVLRKFRDAGKIAIEREDPAVFGSNPLLSASVVVWRPIQKEREQ